MPEGAWFIWLLLCGRGFGKTRTGGEVLLNLLLENPVDSQGRPTLALAASDTHENTYDLMWEGNSGLKIALERRLIEYTYNANKGWVTLTATGQKIKLDNGDDINFGRGGEWAFVWIDELGTFKKIKAAWHESLVPSVRAKLPNGALNRIFITTTARIETRDAFELIKEINSTTDGSVVVTHGTTWDNAHNLPEFMIENWKRLYPVGTRLYRQEFLGELLDEIDGALWTQANIDETRIRAEDLPDLKRVLVSVDPAATSKEKSDDTGIIVGGCAGPAGDQHNYILEDRTIHAAPDGWGKAAVMAWWDWQADGIVYETNMGGEMVKLVLDTAAKDLIAKGVIDRMPKTIPVNASRGKILRAEPIHALYVQGRVHHVGSFPHLEEEYTTFVPGNSSPDRMDAAVHLLTVLNKTKSKIAGSFAY